VSCACLEAKNVKLNVDADIVVSMTFDVRDKSTLDQDFCES
jgi:hypothetical protein